MAQIRRIAFLLLLLFAFTRCGKSPQEIAVTELATRGIAYNEEAFVKCASKGDAEEVDLFLAAGMDPNAKDKDGVTPLVHAAFGGHTDIVETLLFNGADISAEVMGFTALRAAASEGQTACVEVLLENGADVNRTNELGYTPLISASMRRGAADTVRLLLDSGADVNAKTKGDMTALYHAARAGDAQIVKALIDSGADVNARTIRGGPTPLMAAKHGGHSDVVKLLKKAGARQ